MNLLTMTESEFLAIEKDTTLNATQRGKLYTEIRADAALRERLLAGSVVGESALADLRSSIAALQSMGVSAPAPAPTLAPAPIPAPIPAPSPVPEPAPVVGAVDATMPNRPTALPVLMDWQCDDTTPVNAEIGFTSEYGANPSVRLDSSGPKSPGKVRRHTIHANPGQQASGGYVYLNTNHVKEGYMARWLRPSSNLIGDAAGSKSSMWGFHAGGAIYFNYETNPDPTILPIFLGCGVTNPAGSIRDDMWIKPNRASTPLVRGQWGLWEFYVKVNDPGQFNAALRVWANGILQLELMGFKFGDAQTSEGIGGISSNFYQNGGQDFDMWFDMDHIFVSGR